MKKIDFFLHHRDRKKMLYRLQKQGVYHLEISRVTAGEKEQRLSDLIERYRQTLNLLARLKGPHGALLRHSSTPNFKNAREQLQDLEEHLRLKEQYENALQELEADRRKLEVWGDFSWEQIDTLRRHGLKIDFYIASPHLFDNYNFGPKSAVEIERRNGRVYFLALSDNDEQLLPFERARLPLRSLSEIDQEIALITAKLKQDQRELSDYAHQLPQLEEIINSLESQHSFAAAYNNLEPDDSKTIYHIKAWYPLERENEIRNYLDEVRIAYLLREPEPQDQVPVLLKNGFFSRIFEPITRIFSLPDYFEIDPTPYFAPFFTIFFGLCLGDAGYGFLVVVGALFGVTYLKKEYKPFALLTLFLGMAALVSGVLMNSFFGETLFTRPDSSEGLLSVGGELAILSAYNLEGRTLFPVMSLALLLGYIQIVSGVILKAVNRWRRFGLTGAFAPAGQLAMMIGGTVIALHGDYLGLGFNSSFTVGPLPVGALLAELPLNFGKILLTGGALLFFLYCQPEKKMVRRILPGLWEFYGVVTGLLGDLLSYLRLFALGLASGLLGNSFNQIAFMVLPTGPQGVDYFSPWLPVTVVILILGHALNLVLSLLGSFVHPLRLTFVEFYKNINYKGGGVSFRPFIVKSR